MLSKNAEEVAKARYFMEGETWPECARRVAKAVGSVEKDDSWVVMFEQMIHDMNFLPAGRILRNAGRQRGSMFNCYALSIGDSIEEIGQCYKDSLILWSEGGGVGINFSTLRPADAPILGKGGKSSGMVSFISAADSVASTIESGGSRRAAGLVAVEVSHPEVLNVIDAKLEDGRIAHFNLSVGVNNEFLKAVEADDDWEFSFQQKSYGKMSARKIWGKILKNMISSAEPGLINFSNLKKNNSYYFAPIVATNPCFSGDTLIQTRLGPSRIDSLLGKNVQIWDGNGWVWCDNFRVTGVNERVLKIELQDGSELKVTPYHTMVLEDGSTIKASELLAGDKLKISDAVPSGGSFSDKKPRFNEVVRVVSDGVHEKVYCCTVESTHKIGLAIGIVTGQCGEVPLDANGCCCLGSLVLPNFILGQGGRTQWKKLEETIRTAIRFLDDVIDVNKYVLPKVDIQAHNSRRIGLGIMGLAEYLFAKELRYGSPEALVETERMMKFVRDAVYSTLVELAVEKGAFPKFDPLFYGQASFVRKLPASIRRDIKAKGVRCVTGLAIAPTGTISLLPDVSSGCEPLFSKAHVRKDRVGERLYVHKKYKELIESGQEPPVWYVDTFDLTPEDHFETQAAIQKYVDGSVSKTINLPAGTTDEKLSGLLQEYLYDLKGCTVYVDGSKKGQILNRVEHKDVLKMLADGAKEAKAEAQGCANGKCDL